MGLLDFLFGKTPKIFDADGSVRHDLSEDRWEAWQNRYKSNPEYNWKNHTGKKAKAHSKKQSAH